MPSLRMEFSLWNARQKRARDAYHEQPAHTGKAQPCRVCGTRTEALEGFCLRCRKDARHDPHA